MLSKARARVLYHLSLSKNRVDGVDVGRDDILV
jgi:hypothetical protein